MCWGAFRATNFPCKLRLKFFLRPGGAYEPTAPLAMSMQLTSADSRLMHTASDTKDDGVLS